MEHQSHIETFDECTLINTIARRLKLPKHLCLIQCPTHLKKSINSFPLKLQIQFRNLLAIQLSRGTLRLRLMEYNSTSRSPLLTAYHLRKRLGFAKNYVNCVVPITDVFHFSVYNQDSVFVYYDSQ